MEGANATIVAYGRLANGHYVDITTSEYLQIQSLDESLLTLVEPNIATVAKGATSYYGTLLALSYCDVHDEEMKTGNKFPSN